MAAHILVACGNGIATSTVVASKIKTFLAEKGVEVETTQTKLMEVPGKVENYDLLVTTGQFEGQNAWRPLYSWTASADWCGGAGRAR